MFTDLNDEFKDVFVRLSPLIIKSDEIKSAHEHIQNE